MPLASSRGRETLHLTFSLFIWLVLISFVTSLLLILPDSVHGIAADSSFSILLDYYTSWLGILSLIFLATLLFLEWRGRQDAFVQAQRHRIFVRVSSLILIWVVLIFLSLPAEIASSSDAIPDNYVQIADPISALFTLLSFSILAMFATGMGAFVFGPGMGGRFKRFSNDEVFGILARFQEYPVITDTVSYLLKEARRIMIRVFEAGIPNLNVKLDDILTDVQIVMKIGTDDEKRSVSEFFNSMSGLRSRARHSGSSLSSNLLKELDGFRDQIKASDEFRIRNRVEGNWSFGILDGMKRYEGFILILISGVTAVLTILVVLHV